MLNSLIMKIAAKENDTNDILQTFRYLVLSSSVHCKWCSQTGVHAPLGVHLPIYRGHACLSTAYIRGTCSSTEMRKGYMQNRRQKVVNRWALHLCRGALRSCRGAWHSNLTKIPLMYSVSYFNLWGLGAVFWGLNPPKPLRGNGTGYMAIKVWEPLV